MCLDRIAKSASQTSGGASSGRKKEGNEIDLEEAMKRMKLKVFEFFSSARKLSIYSSSIMVVQQTLEIIKITSRFIDHLAMTTSTEASRRHTIVIAPPSPEPGKYCCSKSGSHHVKAS